MEAAVRFLRPYLWGLLTVIAFSGVKVLVGAVLPSTAPYLLFTIAVVIVAYNFGFWPGVFSVALSTFVGARFFEKFAVPVPGQPQWLQAATFAIQALIICYICGVRIKVALDRTAALEAERAARVELDSASRELQRSEERYRGVIAAVPQIVFVADSEFCFEWLNDRWTDFRRVPEANALDAGWLDAVEAEDRPTIATAISEAKSGKGVLNVELRLKNGTTSVYRWHLARAVPVQNQSGEVSQWIGTFTDVHDSKLFLNTMQRLNEELETRVRVRTEELVSVNRELEGANSELEAFCYAVSHDLRTPLRAIDGFSQALAQDYGGLLPEEGHSYLDRVRSGAHRMDELITSLLKLSRITRQELTVQTVNLSDVAMAAWTELGHAHPNSQTQFDLEPGMTAEADPKVVRIIFDNLLGNALKFTANACEPHVAAGSELTERGKAFFVRDNGVGFSMEYAAKLFTPFERLHSPREYPGSGVGLATVMRCVRKHGGEAWAESVEGQGATFYFTLPS